jgi:hypothetical protein
MSSSELLRLVLTTNPWIPRQYLRVFSCLKISVTPLLIYSVRMFYVFATVSYRPYSLTFLSGKDKLVHTNLVVLFNFDCTKTQRFFLINFRVKII